MMQLSELKDLLSKPLKIFITTHTKPDGDALGSSLAVFHYLLKKGHTPVVVSPTDYGVYLHWLPGNPGVLTWESNREKAARMLQEADLIFCLDFNQYQRTDIMTEPLRNAVQPKVMIDHHLGPEGFDSYRLWNPDASSTAELVYDFIVKMGDEKLIDKNIGTCLYTGLVTDSGSFRYQNVSAHVHRIVAKLLEAGVEHTQVHRRLFDTFSESRLRFFGHCLSNKMKVLHEYRAAYISVTKEELQEYNIQTGDTEGLVNYPLNIDEVVFGALIIEREKLIKLSLRSKGSFPANEFAGEYFEGGGHLNAAGGSFKGSLDQAVETFIAGLKKYKTLLLTD